MTTSRRWGALCLGLTAFTSFVFSPPLLGQNPTPPAVVASSPAPGAATGEAARVIVTGSNIPSAEEVGPNPVDTYNRDYMNKSGERTTEQFLLDIPTVNANVVPTSNNRSEEHTSELQSRVDISYAV